MGFGALLAHVYIKILHYRTLKTDAEKKEAHYIIHKIYKSPNIGWSLILFGLAGIFGNLLSTSANNADPSMSTPFENGLYYALSRPTWILAVFSIIIAIFTNHFGFARAFLATSSMRAMSKALIICCVLQILIIELLFCSNATPLGI